MKKIFALFALATLLAAPLSGCNTVSGLGQDMKAAGNAVTNSAERTRGN